jgi:hypothetical protein
MQNKKKVIIFYLLLFVISSCKDRSQFKEQVFLKYYSTVSDSTVLVPSQNVKYYKENLFYVNGILTIGLPYFEDEFEDKSASIVSKKKAVLLFNSVTYNLNIDTTSYEFLVKDLIAKDSSLVIAFPKGKYKLPFIEKLRLNPSKTKILDRKNTYLSDDKFIYCIPTNTYLNIKPTNFIIEEKDGIIYGKTESNFYYLDEKVKSPKGSR